MMSQTSSRVTCRSAKFLGDDGQRRGRGLADAQRQVAGRAAHADDEIPARGGAGVLGEVADDADAVWRAVSKPNVGVEPGSGKSLSIVLGTWATRMLPPLRLSTWLPEKAVSSPPMVTSAVMPSFSNTVKNVVHVLLGLGRVGARRAEDGAALEVNVLHVADGERLDLWSCSPFDDALEAVAEADDLVALVDAFDRDRRDDAVDAGGRTAADQNSESAFAHVIYV